MTDFLLMVGGAVFAMVISSIVNYKKSVWVGLTDEERKQLWHDWENGHVVEATEAKLKEKNT
jgi:hypothetical protein